MIKIDSLRIELAGFTLQDIDLSIQDGEFFTLLGPTGAGKTLVLEAIAGVTPITSGRIWVKGRDITHLSPEQRGIGIVYQDYALFPHLSVLENITYGLRYHKADLQASRKWIKKLMAQLGLQALSQRSIRHLSGGEKQRVALARALAVNPSVLLLDEPLSALDPNFREEIREVLKKLHQRLETTFLMVTHDFAEALFLSERTAVLNRGNIEQVGRISEVFRHPATLFVAEFMGMKNIFPAIFKDTKALVENVGLDLEVPPGIHKGLLAIRPEDIIIRKKKFSGNGMNAFQGKVLDVIDRGPYNDVSVRIGDVIFSAMLGKNDLFELDLRNGKDVHISIPASAIHVLKNQDISNSDTG
ncbi:MAG: ABC transporter ATP-binding protein [Deltaproteobacteria bacterium]|nr:ABC transporter ATP-binding protein [Deltaproteobacteria bacterium]MBW1738400.1 ABC transporter ATP-binding protein [Deltaproteobacteria bacterium]MBW1909705.1 ABC transporter ATP-binding protein [Deltaproteobacteria bacterium]MBW2034580.1 ABC transporter ATP-binding protein [Deltaproteobacteria bacterium]MBW2115358.1 ABC transporter ATP-binding protein [Deltaproteobacteria bacterium]